MELKKCVQGHYYDASMHTECPTCKSAANGEMKTVGLDPVSDSPSSGETMDFKTAPVGGETMPAAPGPSDDGKTMAVVTAQTGIDPVVGWLVCTSGAEKGKDYRIHSDNNFIGRSESMDICIHGDDTISRERHAIIAYDTKEKKYFFAPGEGRSITRLNGAATLMMTEIHAFDRLEIGQTELMFIPLCGDNFEW